MPRELQLATEAAMTRAMSMCGYRRLLDDLVLRACGPAGCGDTTRSFLNGTSSRLDAIDAGAQVEGALRGRCFAHAEAIREADRTWRWLSPRQSTRHLLGMRIQRSHGRGRGRRRRRPTVHLPQQAAATNEIRAGSRGCSLRWWRAGCGEIQALKTSRRRKHCVTLPPAPLGGGRRPT